MTQAQTQIPILYLYTTGASNLVTSRLSKEESKYFLEVDLHMVPRILPPEKKPPYNNQGGLFSEPVEVKGIKLPIQKHVYDMLMSVINSGDDRVTHLNLRGELELKVSGF